MSEELKPCPFCGGTDVHVNTRNVPFVHQPFYYVECVYCYITQPRHDEQARDKWNARPIEDQLRAELEQARKWAAIWKAKSKEILADYQEADVQATILYNMLIDERREKGEA